MRVISQCGLYDFPYENCYAVIKDEKILIGGAPFRRDDMSVQFAEYSSREKAERALEMLHNAYVGIIKGLNVDISADTAEKIREMMKTGYGMLIAKENYNGDRLEFYPMNTVFRFPSDEDLEE